MPGCTHEEYCFIQGTPLSFRTNVLSKNSWMSSHILLLGKWLSFYLPDTMKKCRMASFLTGNYKVTIITRCHHASKIWMCLLSEGIYKIQGKQCTVEVNGRTENIGLKVSVWEVGFPTWDFQVPELLHTLDSLGVFRCR